MKETEVRPSAGEEKASNREPDAASRTPDQTPDEAKDEVKQKVARGVARVAGALEGFAQRAREDGLAQTTRKAVGEAGETVRSVAEAAKQQANRIRAAPRAQTPDAMPIRRAGSGTADAAPAVPPTHPPSLAQQEKESSYARYQASLAAEADGPQAKTP